MNNSAVFPGFLILLAACAALFLCNVGYNDWYQALWAQKVSIGLGGHQFSKVLLPLINEGFMALFFLLVTLEIRYEFLFGVLNNRQQILLPVFAALGGMLVPAGIYIIFNWGESSMVGWAIPTATDIAFSLACLMLLGKRLPEALRVFLLSLAVIDDLGAILIIAIYYSDNLSHAMLASGFMTIAVMLLIRSIGVKQYRWYFLLGAILWGFMVKSGVHATLSGCIIALLLPVESRDKLLLSYNRLLPWVQYAILPLFAFANTGVVLSRDVVFMHPMFLGIVLGLVVGKPLGVATFAYVADKLNIAKLPHGVNYHHIIGVGLLCGIGFTMSLFVGMLAFDEEMLSLLGTVRAAVLSASVIAAILGMVYLMIVERCNEKYSSNH